MELYIKFSEFAMKSYWEPLITHLKWDEKKFGIFYLCDFRFGDRQNHQKPDVIIIFRLY